MDPVSRDVPGERYLQTDDGRSVALGDVEAMHAELAAIDPEPEKVQQALLRLADECFRCGRADAAVRYLAKVASLTRDDQRKAFCFLQTGRAHEASGDFRAAADAYRQGVALPPTWTTTWYFLNNNLGYSLNQLRSFAEAEGYCRTAIAFQPLMHNAHKNLGISLQGQGRFAEAACALLEAARIEPSDRRAIGHLEDLLAQHPELGREHPEILEQLSLLEDRRPGQPNRPM